MQYAINFSFLFQQLSFPYSISRAGPNQDQNHAKHLFVTNLSFQLKRHLEGWQILPEKYFSKLVPLSVSQDRVVDQAFYLCLLDVYRLPSNLNNYNQYNFSYSINISHKHIVRNNQIQIIIIYIKMQMSHQQEDGDETVKSVPKYYADEALKRGPSFYQYQSEEQFMKIKWQDASIYLCQQKVGRGKYSQVFYGINLKNSQKCVIKMLKTVAQNKITREVKLLMALNNHENIIKLIDLVKEHNTFCLVFEKVHTRDTKALFRQFTPKQGKFYLYQILDALNYCHSMGIMHRDIKPTNMVIDLDHKKIKLIDWGLGEFYIPNKNFNVHVASRYYKPPELLLDYEYYHYTLDIWCFGAFLASFVFKLEPMFKGADNVDQLRKITQVLGTPALRDYVIKYNMILDDDIEKSITYYEPKSLLQFVNENNKERATPNAIDLLQKILIYDHDLRPSAQQCMDHPYFDEIRDMIKSQKRESSSN